MIEDEKYNFDGIIFTENLAILDEEKIPDVQKFINNLSKNNKNIIYSNTYKYELCIDGVICSFTKEDLEKLISKVYHPFYDWM